MGDVLRISVWKEPDFSSTVQVRTDGKISIPLLDEMPVVGDTPVELAAYLTERLRKYVEDPRVTVILSQARPPTIYMIGETGRHGPMALTPNMTVLQALITAGLTTFARAKKIYILRAENGVEKKIHVNYKQLVKGKSMNQNILLEPGDMIVVP
jgi:polysaccharide export outer membrane protein